MSGLYLGVDGGGTKTIALVGDSQGRILGIGHSGGSNHQTVGTEGTKSSLEKAVHEALDAAGATRDRVVASAFALAGADFASDHALLEGVIDNLWPGLRRMVVNDVWGAWRGGATTGWGLAAIAGTGSNVAGKTVSGQMKKGLGLTYEYGSRGGATHMLTDARYHIFRAGGKAGPETALLPAVLAALSLPDVDALAQLLYAASTGGDGAREAVGEVAAQLVPVLFELAADGDAVAQQIIVENAMALGEQTGGMARILGMEKEPVEVVIAGSLFERPEYPLFHDAFLLALHRLVPRAWAHTPRLSPAVGAYLLALDEGGVTVDEAVRNAAAASQGEVRA